MHVLLRYSHASTALLGRCYSDDHAVLGCDVRRRLGTSHNVYLWRHCHFTGLVRPCSARCASVLLEGGAADVKPLMTHRGGFVAQQIAAGFECVVWPPQTRAVRSCRASAARAASLAVLSTAQGFHTVRGTGNHEDAADAVQCRGHPLI
jgi:hypothetical protein